MKSIPPVERFWQNVQKTDTCWLWTGCKMHKGYGVLQNGPKMARAHRFSYELAYGPIEAGMLVCHRCDTPACVRPTHLFLGTHKDNLSDAASKGRMAKGAKNGSNLYPERLRTKLKPETVVEIRQLYAAGGITYKQLAKRFGVSKSAISCAMRRISWGRIP